MRRIVVFLLSIAIYAPQAFSNTTYAQSYEGFISTLNSLEVKGRAPKTGYSRAQFPHWSDLDQDLTSGIKGLPQLIGKKNSRVVVSALLIFTTLLLNNVNPNTSLLVIGLAAAIITSFAPDKLIFKALMITAVVDLILLLSAAEAQIGSLVI